MRYLPRALKLVWVAARNWTLAWLVLLAIQGLLPAITVYLTRSAVDNLVVIARHETAPVQQSLWLVGIIAGILLFSEMVRSAMTWVRTAQAELIQDYLRGLIQQKSASLDLEFL